MLKNHDEYHGLCSEDAILNFVRDHYYGNESLKRKLHAGRTGAQGRIHQDYGKDDQQQVG